VFSFLGILEAGNISGVVVQSAIRSD